MKPAVLFLAGELTYDVQDLGGHAALGTRPRGRTAGKAGADPRMRRTLAVVLAINLMQCAAGLVDGDARSRAGQPR